MSANEEQKKLIESQDGLYIVDAGAGTGKTYALTQRYCKLLEQGVQASNILFITFTRNAAKEMKGRVLSQLEPEKQMPVLEAPILNFDSLSFEIVSKYGLHAGRFLGIDEDLAGHKLLTEPVLQMRQFEVFFRHFLEEHESKYEKILLSFQSSDLFSLLEKLLSKGIYPLKQGWFLDGEKKLKGNDEEYKKFFSSLNKEKLGKYGKPVQSLLLAKVKRLSSSKQFLDFPSDFEKGKQVDAKLANSAFFEERQEYFDFLHHVFLEYIRFMLRENSLTFSLTAMFSFLILYHDEEVRKQYSFDYVMVDEFQDTNEMQFLFLLLLLKKSNLCVVGDWKQGIYGFRNAAISNITEFPSKIVTYKNVLNADKERLPFDFSQVSSLSFLSNYRSSEKILRFSERALTTKGTEDEELNCDEIRERVVSLKNERDFGESSEIVFYESLDREAEIDCVLQKIQSLVGKKTSSFVCPDGSYKERLIEFSDIAILSRTRTFGLEIQKRAREFGLPAVYEGGIELFSEEAAILLLAWLKLLLYKDKREAWIPLLEKEGYSYAHMKEILETKQYPAELLAFREDLLQRKTRISYLVGEILKRYSFDDPISQTLLSVLDGLFHSSLMSLSELIVFIEESIERGETYSVEFGSQASSAVKIQTIHTSKGLEYPIVFLVNCNTANFPSSQSSSSSLSFHELVGLRCKKNYSCEHEFIFDNWKAELVNLSLFSDLDEERRLLYVALTRAMSCVYVTAHKPSAFFRALSVFADTVEKVERVELEALSLNEKVNTMEIAIQSSPEKKGKLLTAHDLFSPLLPLSREGRGTKFGLVLHKLAFRYAKKLNISKVEKEFQADFEKVKMFIDKDLKGAILFPELECSLPMNSNKTLLQGRIDLLAVFEDRVEIIDWKTDLGKELRDEYVKQLSAYFSVVRQVYPEKNIICKLFWTCSGEAELVCPDASVLKLVE
ncbi:UvrD-helicase domain-containing protein [Candidatus Woesearchaeota archaeon]|nr:UvrD-helicase domain-containing protein [Nanoarchaeota archaeon]MCB9370370.1 UvrD-helicase domain-containing protein [Candidatus Woesearchaeota archaeon]USN44891.1 MAG: UvrD-helicase domain-containing protein [Candidatus Woesearchaeota archaeon]